MFTYHFEENRGSAKFHALNGSYFENKAAAPKLNIIFVISDFELVENHSYLDFSKFVKMHELTPWVFF